MLIYYIHCVVFNNSYANNQVDAYMDDVLIYDVSLLIPPGYHSRVLFYCMFLEFYHNGL